MVICRARMVIPPHSLDGWTKRYHEMYRDGRCSGRELNQASPSLQVRVIGYTVLSGCGPSQ